ncbi:LysM peptidoglycan-binding domain-containing protein [Vibrio sp. T187]|uniref:LysM peptidoglycan-binding domain-containing protein n=1 Tax=Vibrio TaxID=662 RepID=UPI0010C939DA|nr:MULTISPECIES: LysM peptidoglycan-binding domain-containing protein [Vibrio]MBW3695986.1 LysM peptidoglycan-binding domain-containing protein [Vibrio sp. T187]
MRYQSKPVDSMPLMAPEDTFEEKTQTTPPNHPTSTNDPQEATLEYNVALACSLDEVKAFSIDSFVIAETEKEKSTLSSWVKSRGSDDISTILSTPILVNEPKTLLYQFAGSKKTALSYDNVLPVKKGSAVYRDVFIPVKPSVQVGERLGWPTEGYFYHFIDDVLSHEYKIAGNNKWGFNVTESTKEGLSDEIIVSKPQSTILLPYKIDNQVIARQHLLYRKEKLSQDLLLDDITGEWLDEYACPLDMDVVFSTRTASIVEKEKEQDGKVIYIIKSGDNLSKVARRQGITLDELLSLNPRFKDSPDRVNVGDEIIIEVTESYSVEPEYHTCQRDIKTNQRETWSSIAALYNLSAKSLLVMNPDYEADPSSLSLGDKLQVTLSKESSGPSSIRSPLPAEDVTTLKTAFAHSNIQCAVSSKTHCHVQPVVDSGDGDQNTPVIKVKQLILRSEPLSTSDKLELLASGDGEALSKGSKGGEVKAIQEVLIDLGFDLGADGDFGRVIEGAVKQFQAHYMPTHTIHKSYQFGDVDGIVGKNTIIALDEAVKEGWKFVDDEMDEKWLTVPKGKFTFDSEGDDNPLSPYFSRQAHVPNNSGVVVGRSGITIGRGLDMGNPPTGATGQSPSALNLKELFQKSGLMPELSNWLLNVEGIQKEAALESLNNSGLDNKTLTLTRKQQHLMFNQVYAYMEDKTRILLTKPDVREKFGVVDWDNLSLNVRNVLVDLTYRGDNSPSTREVFVPALVNYNAQTFKAVMSNVKAWRRYDIPRGRFIARKEHLE